MSNVSKGLVFLNKQGWNEESIREENEFAENDEIQTSKIFQQKLIKLANHSQEQQTKFMH